MHLAEPGQLGQADLDRHLDQRAEVDAEAALEGGQVGQPVAGVAGEDDVFPASFPPPASAG